MRQQWRDAAQRELTRWIRFGEGDPEAAPSPSDNQSPRWGAGVFPRSGAVSGASTEQKTSPPRSIRARRSSS